MLKALLLSHFLSAHADTEGTVWVTTLHSHVRWRVPHAHQGAVTVLAFSPDGCSLASGGQDGRVLVWEMETGHLRHSFQHSFPVEQLHWSSTHLLASTSQEHIQVWSVQPPSSVS